MDFAHTPAAERSRLAKATQLAQWCYARGIDHRVQHLDAATLRFIARQADVNPPHQGGSPSSTWRLVGDMLTARTAWDVRHHRAPPPRAQCLTCAAGAVCALHAPVLQ